MEEKLKRNIKVLEERVEEYDKELEEVNLKKDSLRINIKVIDDELNQIKIDKGESSIIIIIFFIHISKLNRKD